MDDSGATIEQDVRFSESILWKLQRQYYDLRGPQAWASGAVPSYVTTNPYIAHVYAHIVLAYLRDAAASLDRERPIYIVELAAGSGRFAYLFLKAFHALKNASSVRALDVRYVMTDFTRANVRAWAAQPAFKPVKAGIAADVTIGILNGILGGLTGLVGIVMTIWSQWRGWSKDVQRTVFQPVIFAAAVLSAISLGLAGAVTVETAKLFLLGLPLMLAGLWLGFKLYGKLDDAAFRKVILCLLVVAGLSLMVPASIFGLVAAR